jgi:hypothetical protein
VDARDACFVGLPVKPAGDTRAGDRLRRVLDGPRQAHGPRAPVCPGTSPRRGRPQSAAADSHARPAAWRERYRRGQHGDCSTKRDYGSPIRVTFSEVSNWPDVVCCARPETRLRVPTATGGRAAPVRLKRPAECPTLTAEVALSGRRVIVGHRASRRWRTGPIPQRPTSVRYRWPSTAWASGADEAVAPPDGGRRHGRHLINIGSRVTVFNSPNRLVHNCFRETAGRRVGCCLR